MEAKTSETRGGHHFQFLPLPSEFMRVLLEETFLFALLLLHHVVLIIHYLASTEQITS
jgi:hypothetical protein